MPDDKGVLLSISPPPGFFFSHRADGLGIRWGSDCWSLDLQRKSISQEILCVLPTCFPAEPGCCALHPPAASGATLGSDRTHCEQASLTPRKSDRSFDQP